ncbi:glycosyltransferase family 4 protein [Saccharothrix coeruleofusca]|uniref:Glycosyl transferase n=1 Tax=Saccharothrix coeruleofusca TaxID=33919 RepID=A0A918AQK6_9PSEU|nr:glycosyltransferase family 1 protein [Saccharothrix coeruleofusca]MBP2339117.1 glycosyltransferase involved in cell wall biosynthesis [Saccharothrix coeruleofusca]GGP70046.1 glycosyl transferase [Saccharothrix coeruleofusca]
MPNLVVLTEQLLAPVPGGTGRYTRELAAALAATAPAGWTVTGVVSRHADPSAAVIPGVEGPRVLPLPRRALIAAWERGVPYWPGGDAVHAPTPLAPPRGRVVVTVHDTVPWTHPETLTARGAAWHQRVISRAASRAAALVVPTEAVAEDLRRRVPVGAPVHVVGHGVTAFGAEEPVDVPERYVLAVGTVEPRKGFDLLAGATAEVGVPLVVVGPRGWGGVELRAPHVRLLGRLSDAQLAFVLRRAAVLAAPSLAEGFGLPLLEAMAQGVPVVHSDAPALVEVAGGAGVAVPRGDRAALAAALRSVLADPREAGRMAEAGRRRAERFTWENAASAVWGIHLGVTR